MKEETKALALAKKQGLDAVVNRLFATKTPKEFIKTRPGANGMVFPYVEIGYVTNELNKAFGIFWEFKIVDKQIGKKQLWVQGQLTIKEPKTGFTITKESFGGADVKYPSMPIKDKEGKVILNKYGKAMTVPNYDAGPIDIANDLKAAVSDCTKKCASMFGIAADVYFKNQSQYDQMESVIDTEDNSEAVRKIVNSKFFAVASERGFTSEVAKTRVKEMYRVEHMAELTTAQLEKAIENLERNYQVVEEGQEPLRVGAIRKQADTLPDDGPEEATTAQEPSASEEASNQPESTEGEIIEPPTHFRCYNTKKHGTKEEDRPVVIHAETDAYKNPHFCDKNCEVGYFGEDKTTRTDDRPWEKWKKPEQKQEAIL